MIQLLRTRADLSPRPVVFRSPYGMMRMLASEKGISRLDFVDSASSPTPIPPFALPAIELISGCEPSAPVTLLLNCSDFQFSVLSALLRVRAGQTATYSQIAAAIGRPSAVRAVASAIARNPIALLIPCHRILPASGGVGNYRWGPQRKRAILLAEQLRK